MTPQEKIKEPMTTPNEMSLVKRKWVYTQPPCDYEIAACSCGNNNNEWSEFEKHLWCPVCKKDFIPEHNGIFDGPICVNVCRLLGIHFNRVNLETNTIEILDESSNTYKPAQVEPL